MHKVRRNYSLIGLLLPGHRQHLAEAFTVPGKVISVVVYLGKSTLEHQLFSHVLSHKLWFLLHIMDQLFVFVHWLVLLLVHQVLPPNFLFKFLRQFLNRGLQLRHLQAVIKLQLPERLLHIFEVLLALLILVLCANLRKDFPLLGLHIINFIFDSFDQC